MGFESVVAPRSRQGRKRPQALPGPHRPRPALARAGLVVAGAGLGAVTALGIIDETGSELRGPGGPATFLGSLTGLVGMYLALLMVLLVSRIPAIERVLGQDGLLRWHRRLAPWPISLLRIARSEMIPMAHMMPSPTVAISTSG